MAEREAILLVRLDGVGDAALCIPSLEGLRRSFPDALFGAICSKANAALYSPRVERIHVYAQGAPVAAMREELTDVRYTRALIATEEVAGYELARLCGAPVRAGFWHRLHKPFKSMWQRAQVTHAVYRPAARTKTPEHEVETLYRLARALGAHEPVPAAAADLRPWLRVESSDEAHAVAGAVGVQITPKWLSLGYTPSAIASLLSRIFSSLGDAKGAVIAASADEDLAVAIHEQLAPAVRARLRLITALPLPRWLGVVDALEVLVTPDTGAAHVAGMLGGRVVDVFEPGDFERLSAQWRPWAGSWRCHAKRPLDMDRDASAYGRLLAAQIGELRATEAARGPSG